MFCWHKHVNIQRTLSSKAEQKQKYRAKPARYKLICKQIIGCVLVIIKRKHLYFSADDARFSDVQHLIKAFRNMLFVISFQQHSCFSVAGNATINKKRCLLMLRIYHFIKCKKNQVCVKCNFSFSIYDCTP